jgi:hypothetical protein
MKSSRQYCLRLAPRARWARPSGRKDVPFGSVGGERATTRNVRTLIHVFLDNARYHHAKIVQEWLARPERRVVLHFVPSYCPHLNPIERLWALMHQHLTHYKNYRTCREFADALLHFLRHEVPAKWGAFRDSVTDNFRVISPAKFRILA